MLNFQSGNQNTKSHKFIYNEFPVFLQTLNNKNCIKVSDDNATIFNVFATNDHNYNELLKKVIYLI